MAVIPGGAILFSSKAIIVNFDYQFDISPLALQSLRMLIVLPFYLLILLYITQKSGWNGLTQRDLVGCIIAGIACYHIASYLDLLVLLYISAGLERIILFCYPAIAVLLGWVLLREKPTRRICRAIVFSYLGIALFFSADLSFAGEDIWFGSLLVFLASILTAWYLISSQKYSRKIGSQRFTCLAMIAASVTMLCHAAVAGVENLTQLPVPVYLSAFSIAIMCTLIPSFMVTAGVKIIGASKAGIVGAAGPLFTILLSNYLLHDPLTWMHLVGLALVIFGMSRMK